MKSDTSTETNSSESIIRVEDLAKYGAITPAEYERSDWETSSTTSSDRLRQHHSRFSESSRTSSASSVALQVPKIPARLARRVTFALPDIEESDDSTKANASRDSPTSSQGSSEYSDLSDNAVLSFKDDPEVKIANPYLEDYEDEDSRKSSSVTVFEPVFGPMTLRELLLSKQDDLFPLEFPAEVRAHLKAMAPAERAIFYQILFSSYDAAYSQARDVHLRFVNVIEAIYWRTSAFCPDKDVILFTKVLKDTYYFDEDCCHMVAYLSNWIDKIT